MHVEREIASLCLVPERPCDCLLQVAQGYLFSINGDGAGLDLREVQDVADQVQQVGPGTVDRARELNLPPRQIAFWIIA